MRAYGLIAAMFLFITLRLRRRSRRRPASTGFVPRSAPLRRCWRREVSRGRLAPPTRQRSAERGAGLRQAHAMFKGAWRPALVRMPDRARAIAPRRRIRDAMKAF